VSGAKGKELVIEFPKLDVAASEGRGQGLVGAYNISKTANGARLKLALNDEAELDRRFLLAPAEGVKNYRYVIDIKAAGATKAPPTQARPPANRAPSATQRANLRKVVVIDPGHGGRDPGALGEHAREKEITLAAAKELKKRLEDSGRYRVVMTRSDDTYIPLENRVQIARRAGADLFISLHADAGANKQTRGASVYTLSDEGSERVAKNVTSNSDWFIDAEVPGGTRAVKQILFDLTQRATRNKSGAFAELLIDKVGGEAPLLTRAHRDARYVVLFAPDVPAVLLEMGFITNSADEKLLTSDQQRSKIVRAIQAAIDEYFAPQVKIAAG
jgi:N-acetylmuramoyl-L-alanine amidase